jgi:hypothetical protein
MDKALKFSGYDYRYHVVEGPHGAGFGDHFEEAMRFLWAGWPEPVKAGPGAPRVQDVILPGEGWQLTAQVMARSIRPRAMPGATCFSWMRTATKFIASTRKAS